MYLPEGNFNNSAIHNAASETKRFKKPHKTAHNMNRVQGLSVKRRQNKKSLKRDIYIYIERERERGPPLWSSGQSSWLQILGSRVRFPGTTREKNVVDLERDSLRLVSTTEELLDRKVAASV
jgi:hypothetical protein